jgi:TolB-like protein
MKATTAAGPAPDFERAIRQQIEHIVSSAAFRTSDRLKHFLTFVAGQALQGQADSLKEYAIGVHVFGREMAFDPRTDPVVRVQARRLRARLEKYYREEGQHDEVVVDLPKGGYAPVFRRREVTAASPAADAAAVQLNTIAVQPFVDLTPGREAEMFCLGLTTEVIRRLTRLKDLKVTASPPASSAVATMAIDGVLRRAADGLRLTVNLVNGRSGCYECSESIPIDAIDTFAAQDLAAETMVERLKPYLAGGKPGQRRLTENLTARNLCKQGLYHLEQRTDESLERAADLFERAVIEDAQYSLAHSGLSDAYSLLGSYGLRPSTSMVTMAMSSAATAVMLDSESAQARTSLAHAKARAHWNWMEAELEFQRAIKLDPANATSHHWYARCCLVPLGRLDEARDHVLLAHSLDPVSSIIAREVASIH